ncbi:CHAT domain-containing protein [Streptomyces sp. NBC_00140]|uniref:CHAT domain-containing protein n=1 Tax=Streptomyces sp. NBC_00140 TaxID=2975664 RepID=UPI002259B76B|nr:CHAT domain-containing protein [Streptomyces sp. NBC_00140]MCX5330437.1 CHAT domain-containing protein [Streptomyces sp. NBC_00140]
MTMDGTERRDTLLAAARKRLRQVRATGDITVLRTPEARADLRALLALFTHGSGDVEVGYRLGWLILILSTDDRDDALLETAADGFALCLLAGVGDLPADLLPGIASVAEPLARTVLNQALGSPDPALLDRAVEQQRRILNATPVGHEARPQRLHNLGSALHARFERQPSHEDLAAALALCRESVDTTAPGDPDLPARLSGLAGALWSRHRLKGETADLDAAIDTIRAAVDAAPAGSPHQALCLSNLGLALRDRFARTGDPADLDDAVAAGRRAWELTPRDEPNRSVRLHNLAGTLVIRYRNVEGMGSLDEVVSRLTAEAPADVAVVAFLAGSDDIPPAVAPDVARLAADLAIGRATRVLTAYDPDAHEAVLTLWRRILRITPPGDTQRHIYLANLSSMLLLRHNRTGAPADLAAALDAARRATRAAPEGAPFRHLALANLAASLGARYQREGAAEDLELAVDVLRTTAQGLPDGHGDRARVLSDLGALLGELFRLHEDLPLLDEAVTALRESGRAVPADPMGRGPALNNLGQSLLLRHEITGIPDDLDEAIVTLRAAGAATPKEHSHHVLCLNSLGDALLSRFRQRGDRQALDEGIRLLRAALDDAPAGSRERARSLFTLASALRLRLHSPDAQPSDLTEAVSLARHAVESAPAGSSVAHLCRSLLVNLLYLRFDRLGDRDALAEAAEHGRELVSGGFDGTRVDLADGLTAGASALLTHHVYDAAPSGLDEAIEAQRTVLRAMPAGSPARPPALHNLALALMARSAHAFPEADVSAAVDAQREAVAQAGPGHSDRAMLLILLGACLLTRCTLLGTPADLDEAIDVLTAASEAAPPGHPARPGALLNWCGAVLTRAEARADSPEATADLDTAVALAREAVDATLGRSPRRQWALGQLGRALLFRYRHRGAPDDLDAAITTLRQAEGADDLGELGRLTVLLQLSEALLARHERDGDPAALDAAVRLSAQLAATPGAPPAMRLDAALTTGRLVGRTDPSAAVAHFETAVALLPQIAPRRLRRRDQQRMLGAFAGLASNAAAAVLNGPEPSAERALELLETGRGVLIGQALDVWSDLAPLRARHPGLAARFEELRDLLDRPDDGSEALLGTWTGAGGVDGTVDRHRLADELTAVLTRIRQQDGFGSFGLPPSAAELRAAARDGAVVVLNVTFARSDALLVTPARVTAVPLPGLTLRNGTEAAVALQSFAHDATDPDDSVRTRAQKELSGIQAWLWEAVARPVLTALGHDRTPVGDVWPRVWWVPCGPLSWLPFHAAGHHDGSGRAVLDRVVSSYSPTVRALHHARRRLPPGTAPGRPLIVAMPDTPGHAPLDFAADEVDVFREHMDPATVLLAPERPPTRDDVLGLLPGCPVAHFACHGDSFAEDPSHHRLLLHDHAAAPFTVEALASVRLEHARLAYLSACATAVSYDGVLADEAMHLTSAFQLCGFRHVIGTLWPVVDDTAVDFAEAFYRALRPAPDQAPDPDRSPQALHTAVRALRAALPGSPSLWASHVHTGA